MATWATFTFNAALKLNSNPVETYSNLSGVYFKLGRFEDSIAAARNALRLKPDDATSYYHLGLSQEKLERDAEAVQSFKQAISLDPKHVSSYKELGQVYLKQREYEKAMVLYRGAISVKPDVFELHMGLSHSLAKLNLEDEALAALNRGILADPSGADAFHRKLVQTDPTTWLETFKKGSETGPEAFEAYNNLGVAYLYLKRYAEAMDVFERLILLDPRHASAYNNLGKAYTEQGDNERARTHSLC
jgi:tetratricopeptide (TPR) repeat protein